MSEAAADYFVAPDPKIAEELVALRRQIDLLELKFSQLATAFNESAYWDFEGCNSGLDWLRINCHMSSTAAADRIAVGERLSTIPESVKAMESGDIGFAHLTVMARTANAIRGHFDETKLLPLARESSPGKFHYQCMHYRHSINASA